MSILQSLYRHFTVDWLQAEVFEKAKNKESPNVRVLAFEDAQFKPGCRKFILADLRKFYLWYRECPLGSRHFYEMVTEHTPCRLYFDLEFYRDLNPEVDALSMLDEFCAICARTLEDLLRVELDPAKDFLILDSSSPNKFSAHLILHIPSPPDWPQSEEIIELCPDGRREGELVFPDNVILKPLVMYICSILERERRCIVNSGQGKQSFLCDLSVYSRNRNFRLFQSNKFGKTECFALADYCTFYNYYGRCKGRTRPMNAQIFLDSLVIPFNYHTMPVIEVERVSAIQRVNGMLLKNGRRMAPKDPNQPGIELMAKGYSSVNSASSSQSSAISIHSAVECCSKTTELDGGPAPSPFPLLDQFMLSKFQSFNENAQIRVWRFIRIEQLNYQPTTDDNNTPSQAEGQFAFKLQYQLTNSRYCMNRGREHRNQNVYWMVDLAAFYFLQRCFDTTDCPGYSSPAFALSVEMCQYLHDNIRKVFARYRIPADQYKLADLDQLVAKRYRASTDSFNKSIEWSQKYGELQFLELLTPCEEYPEEEREETLVMTDQNQNGIKTHQHRHNHKS